MLSRQARPRGRDPGLAARALSRRPAALLTATALVVVAAGCGGGDGGGSGSGGGYDGGSGTPPRSGDDPTRLTVTVYPEGRGAGGAQTAKMSCGAGEPSDAEACEAIDALPDDAVDPVPPGVACTEIYGGPDVVELRGALRGTGVDTVLTRENGCEIDRFDAFTDLLRALFPRYEPGAPLAP